MRPSIHYRQYIHIVITRDHRKEVSLKSKLENDLQLVEYAKKDSNGEKIHSILFILTALPLIPKKEKDKEIAVASF